MKRSNTASTDAALPLPTDQTIDTAEDDFDLVTGTAVSPGPVHQDHEALGIPDANKLPQRKRRRR